MKINEKNLCAYSVSPTHIDKEGYLLKKGEVREVLPTHAKYRGVYSSDVRCMLHIYISTALDGKNVPSAV